MRMYVLQDEKKKCPPQDEDKCGGIKIEKWKSLLLGGRRDHRVLFDLIRMELRKSGVLLYFVD